jgi:probable rRNA maturation factor
MEGRPLAEVSVMLADDNTLWELNRQYRGQDRPTDVLSFSQQEHSGDSAHPLACTNLLGDVVISVETAKRQADVHGHPLQAEVELLVVHGVLHLLGYDDETDESAEEMRMRERSVLDAGER